MEGEVQVNKRYGLVLVRKGMKTDHEGYALSKNKILNL